jgi:hypothetical protein
MTSFLNIKNIISLFGSFVTDASMRFDELVLHITTIVIICFSFVV